MPDMSIFWIIVAAVFTLLTCFVAFINFSNEKFALATMTLVFAIVNLFFVAFFSFIYGKESHEILKRLDGESSYGINFKSPLPTGETAVFLDDLAGGEAWDRIAILKPYPPKGYMEVQLDGRALIVPVPQKMEGSGLH